MRRSLTASFLSLALLVDAPVPVHAGGVFATELTQLLNHGQLIMQYIRQGQQLAEQFKQTLDMARNSQVLTTQLFGPILSDMNQLSSIVQGGMGLAYSMANLDATFRTRYRGYAYSSPTYFTDYKNWSQTTLDTIRGTLRAAGLQNAQMQNEQTVLSGLRSMAQSAQGRMEALQVLNQISEQEVQQLMKLRELMLADLQSKQAYQATEVQEKAAINAAVEQFLKYSRETGDGYTVQSGWK
jgi:P-type conjugative transfer protein TrbJ